MQYRQLRAGVNDFRSKFISASSTPISECLKKPKQDYYLSIYKYNESQYETFKERNSVKGIEQVLTDKLIFDFDSPDPEKSKLDAIVLCRMLTQVYDISESALCISFSGNKGFHVEIFLNEDLTKDEFKNIVRQIALGLKTFDPKIFDHARPFRLLGSYHLISGLYKIRLTLDQLKTLSISQIKELAKNQETLKDLISCDIISLPEAMVQFKTLPEETPVDVELLETGTLDWTKRPKWFPACRWAIYNGLFKAGERHEALMCLVSFFRNQGKNKTQAYYDTIGTIKLQSKINNCKEYDDEEFQKTCVDSIYRTDWKGGQYSCKDKLSWLGRYCLSLGEHKCNHKDDNCFIEIEDFANKFTEFADNIDENRLSLGIPIVDERVMITTSMLVGLLGAPSAGKSTMLFNFLEESNKNKINSVFFSMDMGLPLVYLRLIQKLFGYPKNDVFNIFLNDHQKRDEIIERVKETYKYTKFSFKTGLTTEDMKTAVKDHQEKIGEKVKLVGIDYLECISGPYSDATANAGLIANQCKDMANDLETCAMLLLQTQKHSGDPSDPLLSMRNVKGSSVIEQACAVILSLSRPGFSPINPEDDLFATISTVKDRMGTLMSLDCEWDGLRGAFSPLKEENSGLLQVVRDRKREIDKQKKEGDGWTSGKS